MTTPKTRSPATWRRVMNLNGEVDGDPATYGVRLSRHFEQWRVLTDGRLVEASDIGPDSVCTPLQLAGALVHIIEDSDRWAIYPSPIRQAAISEVCQELDLSRDLFRDIAKWWSEGGALVSAR